VTSGTGISLRSWQLVLVVFLSSACTMVLELVAGRILAPYVGVSLYTWTSIIGIVLAGISLGNYVGGRLADRWASLRLLGLVFIAAGLTSLGILAVDWVGELRPDSWSIIIGIVFLAAALFLVPSAVLGAVSPIVAKLAVRDLAETGSTVGKIYAAGSMGAIAGTFATGFVLISYFGTRTVVWGVALMLLALGFLFALSSRPRILLLALVLLAAAAVVSARQGLLDSICTAETNYFCIKVQETEEDGEPVRILILDRLVHSYTSLNDPTTLVYAYEKMYAEATAYQAERVDGLRALFVGGGGYTFPKYMEAIYPDSFLHVIEIDPEVTNIAHEKLGLSRDTSIVTDNQDARMFMMTPPEQGYDLILGDAFNDFSVPYHLTTKEFNDQVRAWLAPGGLYVVNIIDGPLGEFMRAYVHTMQQTFDYVYLAPTNTVWRHAPRTTFVIIGTDTPIDREALPELDVGRDDRHLKQLLMSDADLEALLAEEEPVTLTDDYAPVDQMLAPLFRNQVVDAASGD
jgi:spermidine synthase